MYKAHYFLLKLSQSWHFISVLHNYNINGSYCPHFLNPKYTSRLKHNQSLFAKKDILPECDPRSRSAQRTGTVVILTAAMKFHQNPTRNNTVNNFHQTVNINHGCNLFLYVSLQSSLTFPVFLMGLSQPNSTYFDMFCITCVLFSSILQPVQ